MNHNSILFNFTNAVMVAVNAAFKILMLKTKAVSLRITGFLDFFQRRPVF
jgi:hypothetical protein